MRVTEGKQPFERATCYMISTIRQSREDKLQRQENDRGMPGVRGEDGMNTQSAEGSEIFFPDTLTVDSRLLFFCQPPPPRMCNPRSEP